MATQKKYVSLEKLGLYHDKIEKVITDGDTAALNSAKEYANSLASNYDVAGAAKTVQDNLDAEILRAKGEEARIEGLVGTAQGEVDALEEVVATKADKSVLEGFQTTVASTYETKEDAGAKLTEAKGYTDTEVAKVQGNVNTLAGKVGEVAEGSTVVAMIGAVEDIADQNAADIETLEGKVSALEAGTYDDTEVRGLITANTEAIDAIEKDYLKAADKTELSGAIALKADQTALDAEVQRAEGVEAGLNTRLETVEVFFESALQDAEGTNVINTLKEIQEYIAGDETGAAEMLASVNKNKEDIASLGGRMDVAEDKLDTVAEGAQVNVIEVVKVNGEALTVTDKAVDVIVPVGALANKDKVAEGDLESALATKINGKAEQTALDAVVEDIEALQGVDSGLDQRIATLEGKFGGAEGSVEDMIADARQEAIDTAAGDATTKANKALEDAKSYADGLNTTMDGRVGVLEAASATHALASDLTALAGRVTTAEGEIDTLQSEMDAVEALAAANKAAHEANASAIALKASQADLEALQGRVTAVETWQANMIECSEEDINGLFA